MNKSHSLSVPLKTPPKRNILVAKNASSSMSFDGYGKTDVKPQDWSKKIQTLIGAYDTYRNNFNELSTVSSTLLRSVEGLDPDYGQYENVPNSGWSHYTPQSLYQQNALSVPDKIAFGAKIGNAHSLSLLSDEKGATELAKIHMQDGGNNQNNFERYVKKFNKALLVQLKNYVDLEGMATKTDDISRLAYTRLKSYFDNLELIIDDEKLQDFTGISFDTKNEIDAFITKKLLPDPMDESEKGKPISLWSEDDTKIADLLKKSKSFNYLKSLLLDTPTNVIADANSLYHQSGKSFLNPYEGLSDTAKNMLNVRRDHIDNYINTLPYDKAQEMRKTFFDSNVLGQYQAPTETQHLESASRGVLPSTYNAIDTSFFKKQKEQFGNPVNEFKEKSQALLEKMNISEQFYNRKNLI